MVTLAALCGGAVAARDGKRGRGRQPAEDIFDALVRERKLTDAQQADVKVKIKARDAALAAWDKANAEKLQAAEAAAKDARSKDDADAKKQTSAAVRELKTARQESAAEASAAVLTVLTAKQKATWGTYELYKTTIQRYRRAELTEEQLAKVKIACAIAAKEISEIDKDNAKVKKVMGEISKKLQWAINALVLNDEQRELLAKKPAPRKKKEQ